MHVEHKSAIVAHRVTPRANPAASTCPAGRRNPRQASTRTAPVACRSSRPARPGPGHRSTATTGRSRYGAEPSAGPLPRPAPSGGRPRGRAGAVLGRTTRTSPEPCAAPGRGVHRHQLASPRELAQAMGMDGQPRGIPIPARRPAAIRVIRAVVPPPWRRAAPAGGARRGTARALPPSQPGVASKNAEAPQQVTVARIDHRPPWETALSLLQERQPRRRVDAKARVGASACRCQPGSGQELPGCLVGWS
jgi:hypothetical protein